MEHAAVRKGSDDEYEAPQVLASYTKEELEAVVATEGQSTGGCGCGGGSILRN